MCLSCEVNALPDCILNKCLGQVLQVVLYPSNCFFFFFKPGFIEHYHVFHSYIFLKVFKVLYPVLVDRSKSPIKYANLCTEKNRAKKETIYSIFSLCIYLYIYIYIYSQTSALFFFEP